ncbi:MAG: serine protease [Planctomycetaceae bacterium]|nr:serine protease [Planctomycetaceae bacterium]
MKQVFACFLSALMAALLTVWLTNDGQQAIEAQDQDNAPSLTFPNGNQRGKNPHGGVDRRLFNADGLSSEEAVNVAVYEHVNKSVVNITTKSTRPDGLFFMDVPAEGTGSGSVIDSTGHILTNFHVVEDARTVSVTLYNGKSYDAAFVGADAFNDVAVIKVDAPKDVLYPVVFGDSSSLKVGMKVFAIGNPFGLERTLTTGIISSLNRSLKIHQNRTIKSIIQIDAAINPGNSGGPLLDSHGRLIGMNTAIASKTGQSSGVGFAIPVNLVSRVVPQLITHGRVIRPEIGIQQVYETEAGLLIAVLTPKGPAELAGLHGPKIERRRRGLLIIERIDRSAADLIIAVDGEEVSTADDFLSAIEKRQPNDVVTITIIREGRKQKIQVKLGGGPEGKRVESTPL